MPSWNPKQYLKFFNQRTRPCQDLARSVQIEDPQKIIDLGCGPGNSTQVLMECWPNAVITGLDSSEQMIMEARKLYPKGQWLQADIASWTPLETYDIVFSNAALQWVSEHERVLPHLLQQVKPGGALAFQVPANINATAHQLMRDLAASKHWRKHFHQPIREWYVHPPAFYYDVLSPHASHIELWRSEYFHAMSGPEAIVEWYKGSGLRPFLDLLPEDKQDSFLQGYLQLIAKAYPRQANGQVLFPFLRLFVIAYL
ncbi:MAG TPA: trans-aconitate 2-methyltransferase [Gammaproteobacteria bacterium]|nr:trans-aconitate 2-methyltransferase [Gammaproteobacteria bacterium]